MFIQTKNIIRIVILLSFGFTSCKKDGANTNVGIGTISVSIDGTATTFNVGAKASVLPVTGGYGIKIFGNKKDPATSATSLTINIVRGTAITTGTYVENGSGNPLVQIDYFFDLFFGSGTDYLNFRSTSNPVTITITDISSSSVKGTFSGELIGPNISGGAPVKTTLSNGVFYVSY
ncbi:MAG: hypothetical protein JWN83_541 [Chitinophagaceae bacterium]|nr:hypothetical protein [Chitinophagaceae bacterium]